MKRERRTIRRRLAHLALLLAVAFVVNVLVAWGLAVWDPDWGWRYDPTSTLKAPFILNQFEDIASAQSQIYYASGSPWTHHFRVEWEKVVLADGSDTGQFSPFYIGSMTGFPVRSMIWADMYPGRWAASGTETTPLTKANAGTWLHRGIALRNGPNRQDIRRLPLRPMLFGSIINTASFALLIALALGLVTRLRRLRRIERGLCPNCGYDAQGLTACPECGRAT